MALHHRAVTCVCVCDERVPFCGQGSRTDPIRIRKPSKRSEGQVSAEVSATFPRCLQTVPTTRSALCTKHNSWTAARLGGIVEQFNETRVKHKLSSRVKIHLLQRRHQKLQQWNMKNSRVFIKPWLWQSEMEKEESGAVIKSWSLPQIAVVTTANSV